MDATTPVVFLHAFPLNASMWASQVRALEGRTVLTPHFPGFGDRSPGEPTLEAFARAVLADMDEAGIQRAAVVGLSMGGYVAFRLHALAPERIAALVLADTRAGADDETGRQKRTDQATRAREEGVGWLPEALLPALLGETTLRERPQVVARVRELMGQANPEGVARALEAMRERPDSMPELERVEVPVLVLVGDQDSLTPVSEARKMVDAAPQGRLTIIPNAGHLSNLEAAGTFDGALRAFLG